jgi:hypothetical protein
MKRWGVAFAVAACVLGARVAHADDRVEVGASFVVASTAPSMNSGGELGGSAFAMRWFGPIALVGEAGAHDWTSGSARWLGGGVRLAFSPHFHNPVTEVSGYGRFWVEAGLAEKAWHLRSDLGDADAWYTGPRAHAGGGIDFGGGDDVVRGRKWSAAMSMWFRVEWGPAPDFSGAPTSTQHAGWREYFYDPIPTKDYVMGMAFVFGGPA